MWNKLKRPACQCLSGKYDKLQMHMDVHKICLMAVSEVQNLLHCFAAA